MNLQITEEQRVYLRNLQKQYYELKTKVDSITKIAEENEFKVLQENVYLDDDGERVLESSCSYVIREEQFKDFLKKAFEKNVASGLPVTDYKLVVAYKELQELRAYEKALLELQLEIIPAGLRENIKKVQGHWK